MLRKTPYTVGYVDQKPVKNMIGSYSPRRSRPPAAAVRARIALGKTLFEVKYDDFEVLTCAPASQGYTKPHG